MSKELIRELSKSHWVNQWYDRYVMDDVKPFTVELRSPYWNELMYGIKQIQIQTPDRVFFNDKKKAVTLIDGDNVRVVKATKGDKYDRKFGFLLAYFQLYSGMTKTQANKYLNDIVESDE